MENLIEMGMSGIQCDNEKCDYEDNDAQYENYEQYVNKPCPKCGENLLTEEDMESAKAMFEMVDLMNSDPLIRQLGEDDDGVRVNLELKMKGDGSITLGKITEANDGNV